MNGYVESLRLPSGSVVRDLSGIIWVKKGLHWQRTGSAGFYDGYAIVFPVEILIACDCHVHPFTD